MLLALAVAIPLLMRARGRKAAWTENLTAATAEVVWFARVLIPQLQQEPSAERVAGGWRVSSARVVAAEDTFTSLETTAPDVTEAARARTLRDAVRSSRARLDAMVQPVAAGAVSTELAAAVAELEAALAAVSQSGPAGPQSPGGTSTGPV